MSKLTLFDIISLDQCPDFNPYFCHIQNGWDNCFYFSSYYCLKWVLCSIKNHIMPHSQSQEHDYSFIPFMANGKNKNKNKKQGSKKMNWFLIFNIMPTKINHVLGSRICDELCEDKRYNYDGRMCLVEHSGKTLPHTPCYSHMHMCAKCPVTWGKTYKLSFLFLYLENEKCSVKLWVGSNTCMQVNGFWRVPYPTNMHTG